MWLQDSLRQNLCLCVYVPAYVTVLFVCACGSLCVSVCVCVHASLRKRWLNMQILRPSHSPTKSGRISWGEALESVLMSSLIFETRCFK